MCGVGRGVWGWWGCVGWVGGVVWCVCLSLWSYGLVLFAADVVKVLKYNIVGLVVGYTGVFNVFIAKSRGCAILL